MFLFPNVFDLELYLEAGFWRCESLKRAIEEQMQLYRSTFEVDSSGVTRRKPKEDKVGLFISIDLLLNSCLLLHQNDFCHVSAK